MASKLNISTKLPFPSLKNASLQIPQLGFGTYLSPKHAALKSCLSALQVGFRHIDTAQYYENEEECGQAVAKSSLNRADVFLTTKFFGRSTNSDDAYASGIQSVEKLGGGGTGAYVDCFLIHSPDCGPAKRKAAWLALERLHKEGKAKSIGVSNFGIQHIEELKEFATVWPPHINQIELHPWHQQKEVVKYCEDNGIIIEAYCPIVRNQKAQDQTLVKLAEKYKTSTNQVLIRWSLQRGYVCLVKSDNSERIKSNADVYDFDIDEGDMKTLNGLDEAGKGSIVYTVKN